MEREGANLHMGCELPAVLERAGLTVEHVCAEGGIQGQSSAGPLAFIAKAMLPRMVQHGVVGEAEVDIDTLAQRLAAERPDSTVYVSDMAFGAWARKPGIQSTR